MKQFFFGLRNRINDIFYRNILKNLFFQMDPELIHEKILGSGQRLGSNEIARSITKIALSYNDRRLEQKLHGIRFSNPVGLAAGFDYDAQLTQLLPYVGFGFGTVGTITNKPYGGNPRPRLGRLVKSRSLMVNKGFKNKGIKQITKNLRNCLFEIPVGISIGPTNSRDNSNEHITIQDIVSAFRYAEKSRVPFSYYELNISCPNLFVKIDFYNPKNLRILLKAVTGLSLSKPLFVKMPISKTDDEIRAMLKVITSFPVKAVIFGNLQKNRYDPSLNQEEVGQYKTGNFSGKPTEKRSNELIRLAYREYGNKIVIIGCGGVFSAEDAYKKIKLGASLIQLITGMIFEGPQLIGEINHGLVNLLKRDGYENISQAVGTENKRVW